MVGNKRVTNVALLGLASDPPCARGRKLLLPINRTLFSEVEMYNGQCCSARGGHMLQLCCMHSTVHPSLDSPQ